SGEAAKKLASAVEDRADRRDEPGLDRPLGVDTGVNSAKDSGPHATHAVPHKAPSPRHSGRGPHSVIPGTDAPRHSGRSPHPVTPGADPESPRGWQCASREPVSSTG